MPFGLCNAGATFQPIMEMILHDLINSFSFIDHIFTHSQSFEEHLVHLELLFQRFVEAKLKIKTSKFSAEIRRNSGGIR
jgi:hypothetical protein